MPANGDHPSHRVVWQVAAEEPFATALAGRVPPDHHRNVLSPEHYAVLLDGLGFADQHVRLQVYGHVLPFDRGRGRMGEGKRPDPVSAVLDALAVRPSSSRRYRQLLLESLGRQEPYFYPFKRILAWGRRP